jgi:Flp pilus assembly protein TadG
MPFLMARSTSDRPSYTERVRGERGAAMVEFVLILPVVLLIVFGGITAALSYEHKAEGTVALDANRTRRRLEVRGFE